MKIMMFILSILEEWVRLNIWDVDAKIKIISELNQVAQVDGHVCDDEKE